MQMRSDISFNAQLMLSSVNMPQSPERELGCTHTQTVHPHTCSPTLLECKSCNLFAPPSAQLLHSLAFQHTSSSAREKGWLRIMSGYLWPVRGCDISPGVLGNEDGNGPKRCLLRYCGRGSCWGGGVWSSIVGLDRTDWPSFTRLQLFGGFQTQTSTSSLMSVLIVNIAGLATYYKVQNS